MRTESFVIKAELETKLSVITKISKDKIKSVFMALFIFVLYYFIGKGVGSYF